MEQAETESSKQALDFDIEKLKAAIEHEREIITKSRKTVEDTLSQDASTRQRRETLRQVLMSWHDKY